MVFDVAVLDRGGVVPALHADEARFLDGLFIVSVAEAGVGQNIAGEALVELGGAFLHGKTVIGQLNRIDSTEATPEKIFLPSLLYVERVDGILHIDLIAAEHLPVVLERPVRFIGNSTTDAAS